MEQILPISDLQHRAKKMLEMIRETGEPIIVTQNGRPAAVLMDYENYEGWKLTLEEMSEPDWQEKLARAEEDVQSKKLTSLESFIPEGARSLKTPKKYGRPTHRRSKK